MRNSPKSRELPITLSTQVTLLLQHIKNHSNNAPNQAKKQQLPTPEQFTGVKWDTWKTYAQAKIHIDGTAIGSLEAHYWYLYSCLGSNIKSLFLPPTDPAAASPTYLLESLERVYQDPNKADKAVDRLAKMTQMQEEGFSAYLGRFERTLFEAEAQGLPDLAKISALRTGLSVNLKKRLEVQLILPSRYEDFVKALHQLSQALQRGTAPPTNSGSGVGAIANITLGQMSLSIPRAPKRLVPNINRSICARESVELTFDPLPTNDTSESNSRISRSTHFSAIGMSALPTRSETQGHCRPLYQLGAVMLATIPQCAATAGRSIDGQAAY